MKRKNHRAWLLTCLFALMVVVITFTPLVIPESTYHPMLFGLPYTLWMGILVTVMMVVLTYVSTRVHPGGVEAKKKENQKQRIDD